METTAGHPAEAISFLKNLETSVSVAEPKLICSFADTKAEIYMNIYKSFIKQLSVSTTLKHLILSRILISRPLGEALAVNNALKTIEIKNSYTPYDMKSEDSKALRVYFLNCLERNTILTTISLEGRLLNEEELDLVLSSVALRKRLLSLDSIFLKSNALLNSPFYRFSRLNVLNVVFAHVTKPNVFLRNLCFCEQLEKLDITNLCLKDIFQAFPNWRSELRDMFPLAKTIFAAAPYVSLLKDVISSNVTGKLIFNEIDEYNAIELRSLLAAAERKEEKIMIQTFIPPEQGSVIGDIILFAARLRSKDATWKHSVPVHTNISRIWI